jgi:diguanylate cyclase (GGDEF)-like protein
MDAKSTQLQSSLAPLRARATRHSVIGAAIAIAANLLAVLLSSWLQSGRIDLASVIAANQTNPALWLLYAMPFVFAVWGQYVGVLMARDMGAIVTDHTRELREKTAELEHKAAHDATHDNLTDLPNRILLRDRLDQALRGAARSQLPLALLVLDLNRFKDINDTLGHHAGDRLLKQVAVRLREVVRGSDTLARLGGDEFALLLPALAAENDVEQVVHKIERVFATPFAVAEMKLEVSASVGIALAPRHGTDVDTLMQRADVAMYAAKEERRSYHVYDTRMDRHSSKRLSLLTQLRQAIARDEMVLHFQPKVHAATGTPCGAEALVRWQHPDFGTVPPDEFIQLAEQTGLIQELARWVLRNALMQAASWIEAGHDLGIAVNISPATLLDPEFPDFIAGLCAAHRVPHGTLTLEVTESSLLREPELALGILKRLAELGCAISIDDFGTGYSSLGYLKKMPATELKIDQSFVFEMLNDASDAAIVRATIDLAHTLGMRVVAEGVENERVACALRALGCDILQGFHFARPLPAAQFDAWLQRAHAATPLEQPLANVQA